VDEQNAKENYESGVEKLIERMVRPLYGKLIGDYSITCVKGSTGAWGAVLSVTLSSEPSNEVYQKIKEDFEKTVKYIVPGSVIVDFFIEDDNGRRPAFDVFV
jgi:hypothetical protein